MDSRQADVGYADKYKRQVEAMVKAQQAGVDEAKAAVGLAELAIKLTHVHVPVVERPSGSASSSSTGVHLTYASRSRAIATLGSPVSSVEVDGAPFWKNESGANASEILLPAGQHLVNFRP